ncbi:MAG: ECF-type sigma factor [Gemmatimonadales bacterium]
MTHAGGAGDGPNRDPDLDGQFALIYGELKRLAHSLRQGRAGETLDTTALVHEAYLKLAGSETFKLKNRGHFFAVAARAMRQILVDTARRRMALKRGEAAPMVTLDEALHAGELAPAQLLTLNDALTRLEQIDPRRARVVEHRIFAGLSAEETAEVLGVSRPTVDRAWRAARAWLAVEIGDGLG